MYKGNHIYAHICMYAHQDISYIHMHIDMAYTYTVYDILVDMYIHVYTHITNIYSKTPKSDPDSNNSQGKHSQEFLTTRSWPWRAACVADTRLSLAERSVIAEEHLLNYMW